MDLQRLMALLQLGHPREGLKLRLLKGRLSAPTLIQREEWAVALGASQDPNRRKQGERRRKSRNVSSVGKWISCLVHLSNWIYITGKTAVCSLNANIAVR